MTNASEISTRSPRINQVAPPGEPAHALAETEPVRVVEKPAEPGTPEAEVRKQVERALKKLSTLNTKLEINVDVEEKETVVRIVDRGTGEVVREVPPEEIRKLEASIDRMIGIFFDRAI